MTLSRTLAALAFAIAITAHGPAFAATQAEADAMFAAQNWSGAEDAYEDLLREDRANAANWFSLGRAKHQLNDLRGARHAYETALARSHPMPGRVRFQLARVLMQQNRRADAMRQIEQLAGTNVLHSTLLSAPEFAPLLQDPQFVAVVDRQRPCNTAEFRQFDFWLGEWDVAPVGAAQTGVNRITRAQDGCIVQENYTFGAFTGMSINFYDSARRTWHQTWMSNQGGAVYLEGGINTDGAMEMTDRGLPNSVASGVINRVTWTPTPTGLRQFWQSSNDDGATWSTVFDGAYTRRPAS